MGGDCAAGRSRDVLVVDDEIRSQESLRRTLGEDLEAFIASSAAEALAILDRQWIQIVLCDQWMPGGVRGGGQVS